jgi:hypothetical protein
VNARFGQTQPTQDNLILSIKQRELEEKASFFAANLQTCPQNSIQKLRADNKSPKQNSQIKLLKHELSSQQQRGEQFN